MSICLSHSEVRAFAKALRNPTEGAIKHSEIIADIAGSLGMKPDAMMHFLKSAEKNRGQGVPPGDNPDPKGTLKIDEHFTETLSRRLTMRLTSPNFVTPQHVLFFLALALHRSPDEVFRALKGEEDTRPAKRLVYDEFHIRGRAAEEAREEFRRMFPVYYVRADSLEAVRKTYEGDELTPIGGGWYEGKR
jgi:hypothetical protein